MNLVSGAGAFRSESPGTVPLMTAPHGCHSGRQSVSFSRAAVTLTPRCNGGTEPELSPDTSRAFCYEHVRISAGLRCFGDFDPQRGVNLACGRNRLAPCQRRPYALSRQGSGLRKGISSGLADGRSRYSRSKPDAARGLEIQFSFCRNEANQGNTTRGVSFAGVVSGSCPFRIISER